MQAPRTPSPPFQFSIRAIFLCTTGVAIFASLARLGAIESATLAALLVVSGLLSVFAGHSLIVSLYRRFKWEQSDASVVCNWPHHYPSDPRLYFKPVVQFRTADGGPIYAAPTGGMSRNRSPIGRVVSIRSNPHDPRDAVLVSGWLDTLMMLALGGVVFVFFFMCLANAYVTWRGEVSRFIMWLLV